MTPAQINQFATDVRTAAGELTEAVEKLRNLRLKSDKLALSDAIQDSDLTGENDGIAKDDLFSVLGTTLEAIAGDTGSLYASGHGTNLYKLVK
jgi:hypothetical protein